MKKMYLTLTIIVSLIVVNISAYCQKDNGQNNNGQTVKINILNKDNISINADTLTLSKPLATIHKDKSFEKISEWAKTQAEKGYTVTLSKEEDGTYVAKSCNKKECPMIKKEE